MVNSEFSCIFANDILNKQFGMTAEELKKEQERIHKEIESLAIEKGLLKQSIKPMYDGVCDLEKYSSSSPRIMWVLKEFVDEITDGKPSGGDYKVYDCFGKDKDDIRKNPTWRRLIYTSYGIANRRKWNEMDWIKDDLSMVDILKQIAYINVSKMPGNITSDDNNIKGCYSIWHHILLEQIRVYNPNIIIFGSTFKFFKDDANFKGLMPGLETEPIIKMDGYLDVYNSNNVLLFDAYHPSVWKNDCIKSIIDICLNRY